MAFASPAIRAQAELELRRRGVAPRRRRDPAERADYALRRDPAGYVRDILGYKIAAPQQLLLDALARGETRILAPSATTTGKTICCAWMTVYWIDAVGAQLDQVGRPQGSMVLLVGPSHPTVLNTVWGEVLKVLEQAQALGHEMPGEWSQASVHWRVGPKWRVEVISPPASQRTAVASRASGRHHRNMLSVVEEADAVPERVFAAIEGTSRTRGNVVFCPFNPVDAASAPYERIHGRKAGTYTVIQLDAFEHPNVRNRALEVEDAIDYLAVDASVRAECQDRGPVGTEMDPSHGDFLYALPGPWLAERGPRIDGIPGHPDAEVRVYRPVTPTFEPQVRGRYPSVRDAGLIDPAALARSVARWVAGDGGVEVASELAEGLAMRQGRAACEDKAPDRVGVDVAREGADDTMAAPSWGPDGEDLVRQRMAEISEDPGAPTRLGRIRVGELYRVPKGSGPATADRLVSRFPGSPLVIDAGSGYSVIDHLREVLGHGERVHPVDFGGSVDPASRLPGQPLCLNQRAAMHTLLALLLDLDLIDLPDDPRLRQELLALKVEPAVVTVEEGGAKIRRSGVKIVDKAELKAVLGRSPDASDAVALSGWRPKARKGQPWFNVS